MKTCLTSYEINEYDNIILNKVKKNKKNILFPKNFYFGVSTASHQIEGNNNNNWSVFEKNKNLEKNIGTGSWKYFEDEVKLMKKLGINSYRMSLEWSRIVSSPYNINNKNLNKYYKQIKYLKKNNIQPLITLHHFTRPIWIDNTYGGLHNDKIIPHFLFYVKTVANKFKNEIEYWNTFNEPFLECVNGYITGTRPPERKDDFKNFQKALINICSMHTEAYHILHEISTNCKVSIAKNCVIYNNDYYDLLKRFIVKKIDKIFNYALFDALTTGKLKMELNFGIYSVSINYENVKMKNTIDYIGLNHYNMITPEISYYPFNIDIKMYSNDNNYEKNSMKWDVCPSSLYILLKVLNKKYNIPIMITENGCADNNYEKKLAIKTMKYFMNSIKLAIDEGVNILGYHTWTFIDNYEWDDCYEPRFGLFSLDLNKLEKQLNNNEKKDKSKVINNYGKFYSDIIKFNKKKYES
jgi:beta-glucosidase